MEMFWMYQIFVQTKWMATAKSVAFFFAAFFLYFAGSLRIPYYEPIKIEWL
jgi:predicted small integral membrane protein